MHYISQNPGGGAANLTVATSVFGFIGTPPQFRRQSRLLWKQGPCHLVEEVLSPVAVAMVYQLGPCYTGSFQAPTLSGKFRIYNFSCIRVLCFSPYIDTAVCFIYNDY